jgi:hypothetical protein
MKRYASTRAVLVKPLLRAGVAVPTIRVRDAAHGILREGGGNCAEAEEGSERQCERKFHDPSPLVQGITMEDGRIASRDKPSQVRSLVEAPTNCNKTASSTNSGKNGKTSAVCNSHDELRFWIECRTWLDREEAGRDSNHRS